MCNEDAAESPEQLTECLEKIAQQLWGNAEKAEKDGDDDKAGEFVWLANVVEEAIDEIEAGPNAEEEED